MLRQWERTILAILFAFAGAAIVLDAGIIFGTFKRAHMQAELMRRFEVQKPIITRPIQWDI